MPPAPLFMFGLPRSGTNLVTRVLNQHPEVMVAVHAFQPLFKSLRGTAIRAQGNGELCGKVDVDAPVHDGHFDAAQRRVLDLVHAATLDLPVPADEWPALHDRLVSRASDDAGDLCEGMASLGGVATYRDMLDRALRLIADVRQASGRRWVGMIDTWVIDLLPALARGYPEARFVVIERDPRAIANSMLGYLPVDSGQVGHILSVVRHWRKEGALLQSFEAKPELGERLFRVRYETMATAPVEIVPELCDFLGIEYQPSMLALDEAVDIPTGRVWEGNSTFDPHLDSISTAPVERWRETLAEDAKALVEFAAGADMSARGYRADRRDKSGREADALAFLIRDHERPCSWRCDSEDPLVDFGLESARRDMLAFSRDDVDEDTVRRCFLYPEYFRALRPHGAA